MDYRNITRQSGARTHFKNGAKPKSHRVGVVNSFLMKITIAFLGAMIIFSFLTEIYGQYCGNQIELQIEEKELVFKENDLTSRKKDLTYIIQRSSIGNEIPGQIVFSVPLGEVVNGFKFSGNGELTYDENQFSPALYVNTNNIMEFKISMVPEKHWAGAIAVDGDGQNALFFLDLTDMIATPMQSGKWNAAQEIFWSPSLNYMVALCAYEGERFVSFNTQTKKIIEVSLEKPNNNNQTIWHIDSELNWLEDNDVLVFEVAEYCNPYEGNCGEDNKNMNIVLARYNVDLNAATLSINYSRKE